MGACGRTAAYACVKLHVCSGSSRDSASFLITTSATALLVCRTIAENKKRVPYHIKAVGYSVRVHVHRMMRDSGVLKLTITGGAVSAPWTGQQFPLHIWRVVHDGKHELVFSS
eukprot:SAG31_NODE_1832_length_7148_cov_5.322315_1_plen_113_part_00